jgi:hypothetical protein
MFEEILVQVEINPGEVLLDPYRRSPAAGSITTSGVMLPGIIYVRGKTLLPKESCQVSSGDPRTKNRYFHGILPLKTSMITAIAIACTIDAPTCWSISLFAFASKSGNTEYMARVQS